MMQNDLAFLVFSFALIFLKRRAEKAPSKDLIRLFIRVSALRTGTAANSPWAVNSDLFTKYKLVNKFAAFFLSPAKVPFNCFIILN